MLNIIYDVEFGNYYLMELEPFLPKLTNEGFRKGKIWEMFFDGARSKNGSGTRIILIDPMEKLTNFPIGSCGCAPIMQLSMKHFALD